MFLLLLYVLDFLNKVINTYHEKGIYFRNQEEIEKYKEDKLYIILQSRDNYFCTFYCIF